MLALFSFIGYDRVRLKSEEIAQKAVEKYLKENLERICTKWMLDNAPEIIRRWLNEIESIEKIKESVADDISMHVDPSNE